MNRFKLPSFVKNSFAKFGAIAHCDEGLGSNSLVEEADAILAEKRPKIKTPMQYLEIHDLLQRGNVHTFDGFRVQVQKQLNLNVVVSHFYWIGSQMTGQPIYMYRLILPFDEKVLNVGTDMDFNLEGDFKTPINENTSFKGEFVLGDQAKTGKVSVNVVDESSACQFQLGQEAEPFTAFSYMQSINPFLMMGGRGKYTFGKGAVNVGLGFVYDKDEHQIIGRYSNTIDLLYMRRVNPNRVNLYSSLTFDTENKSKMSLAAEYQLKQSKIQMSVDSTMTIKSTLETSISPGVSLQFSAQVSQLTDQYHFGTAISMG